MNWSESQMLKDFFMSNDPFGGTFTDRLRLYRGFMPRNRLFDMPRQSARSFRPRQDAMQQIQDMADQAMAAATERYMSARQSLNTRQENQETASISSNIFKLTINVNHYNEDELAVNIVGRFLVVKGQHNERQETTCWASRTFVKKYIMPGNVDLDFLRCYLTRDHYLIISVPEREMPGNNFRTVPIRRTESALNLGAAHGPPRPGNMPANAEQRAQAFVDRENADGPPQHAPPKHAPPKHAPPQHAPPADAQTNADEQLAAAQSANNGENLEPPIAHSASMRKQI